MGVRRPRRITFETAQGEDRWALPVLTREQILSLPPSCEMVYAARALGLGRTVAYRHAAQGALQYGEDQRLKLQRVSGGWRFKVSELLALLGEPTTAASGPGPGPEALAAAR